MHPLSWNATSCLMKELLLVGNAGRFLCWKTDEIVASCFFLPPICAAALGGRDMSPH